MMKPPEMIERVARVIDPEAVASSNPNLRAVALRKARAAIEEMKIPTPEMVAAGDGMIGEFMVAETGCYHAMISAALRDSTG